MEEKEIIKDIEINFQQNLKVMILKRLLKVRAINRPTYNKTIKQLKSKEE